jgi:(p)ppGpp synthase/HD superfamily hydrolase
MTDYDRAYQLAHTLHFGQMRKHSGAPYMVHVLKVVERLGRWGFDKEKHENVFVTAFLHDTLEDTDITQEELSSFNSVVVNAVKTLTFPKRLTNVEDAKTYQKRYSLHMSHYGLLPMVVKIADRLSNVDDFIQDKPDYSVKYFGQAKHLFSSFFSQTNNLEFLYGKEIVKNISRDHENTTWKIWELEV